jgi:drug/metabolite transporter (DMT)-like permease
MYERAERSINAGLSLGARIVLAIFAVLFGVVMILIASPESGSKAVFFYGFGAFCLAIAVACVVSGRLRQFVGSVIGTAIFLVGIAYLIAEIHDGAFLSFHRGDPSVYKAVLYLLFIGLPGASYAFRTRFGFRNAP